MGSKMCACNDDKEVDASDFRDDMKPSRHELRDVHRQYKENSYHVGEADEEVYGQNRDLFNPVENYNNDANHDLNGSTNKINNDFGGLNGSTSSRKNREKSNFIDPLAGSSKGQSKHGNNYMHSDAAEPNFGAGTGANNNTINTDITNRNGHNEDADKPKKDELDPVRYEYVDRMPEIAAKAQETIDLYEDYIPNPPPAGMYTGKTHGPVLDKTTGKTYISQFVNNEPHGFGEMITFNGTYFKGYFADGLRQGTGRIVFSNGDLYEGTFEQNKINGYGHYHTAENGIRFEGQFRNGVSHGKGKDTYPDGGYYDGDYFEGRKQGEGVMSIVGVGIYKGEFMNDKFNGVGEFRYAGKQTKMYEGEYKDGLKHGKGVFVTESGTKYVGSYIDDKMDGEFTITDTKGKVKRALFEDGKRVKWL